jgi:SAM-dependent methyltransferase
MKAGPTRESSPQRGFEFADVRGPKLNLGCGNDVRPPDLGWVNADAYRSDDRVVPLELTAPPWPFKDGQFDLVYMSHVLEHVPVDFRAWRGAHRDVLFDVLEEVHRVLGPGGRLVARVPWGGSQPAMAHPQHYRQWRPDWFYYLEPEHSEGYYTDRKFRVVDWTRTRGTIAPVMPYAMRIGPKGLPLTTHLRTRLPFLRPLLERPAELVAVLEKV